MITLVLDRMHFAVHDTGALQVLSPWLPLIFFSAAFCALADGRRVLLRGDELTIRCSNGAATYGLGPADEAGARLGSLLRAWGP